MADLTRFDFHVLRFMKSLDVMSMSTQEVGAYILLLCESWLLGDDCTLPDDPALLARMARLRKVPQKVLHKFPVDETTKWGPRRRNDILLKEWRAAQERSASAARRGKKGNEVRYGEATASLQRDNSETTAKLQPSPNPNQAVPNQTEPEDNDTMALKDKIQRITGRVRLFNLSDFNAYGRIYGSDVVADDFENWFNAGGSTMDNPETAYLTVALKRLSQVRTDSEAEVSFNDPRILEVSTAIYKLSGQGVRTSDVKNFLARHSASDIIGAFTEFVTPLDDFGRNGSVRTFFRDGAGDGIIASFTKDREDRAQQERTMKVILDKNLAEGARKREALLATFDDETKILTAEDLFGK